MINEENLDIIRSIHELDSCEICHGEKGGVPGNENIIDINGVMITTCDYCTPFPQSDAVKITGL